MIRLRETIDVTRPVDEVFAFVGNFGNAVQWAPGGVASREAGAGPPRRPHILQAAGAVQAALRGTRITYTADTSLSLVARERPAHEPHRLCRRRSRRLRRAAFVFRAALRAEGGAGGRDGAVVSMILGSVQDAWDDVADGARDRATWTFRRRIRDVYRLN
jgi:hypothetical protein